VRRIKLPFVADVSVEFADRELALRRVKEWADRGIVKVQVIYGPEGCGKTAWLKQSAELLKDLGFEVVYIDPLRRDFVAYTDLRDFIKRIAEATMEALGVAQLKLATLAIDFVDYALKLGKRRVAILVDDVFQAIGLDKAAMYVKSLLNLIEYPPGSYERVLTVVTTSEGISRREIGRHRWADLIPMWNMPRDGFRELYDQVPGGKPDFDDVWRLTGGNPKMFAELYNTNWDTRRIIMKLIEDKGITRYFVHRWRDWLREAVENPDVLWSPDSPEALVNELVERNLIVYFLSERDPWFWVDTPPPERDLELGIGRYVAWQTPMHREAIRKALEIYV
jgi:hypothetical protein